METAVMQHMLLIMKMLIQKGIRMIYGLENKMWQAAKDGNKNEFTKLVSADAVMVCGGYRCTGEQYAEFVKDFGITDFRITDFEIISETDRTVQVHYIVKTTAETEENEDLEGLFHVTSTWEKKNDDWKLVFNMDSRIMEEFYE